MAKGDIINSVGLDNATLTFQPAAGVEIMITSLGRGNASANVHLYDGSTYSTIRAGVLADGTSSNVKLGLTNSIYMECAASGTAGYGIGYSGVQVK